MVSEQILFIVPVILSGEPAKLLEELPQGLTTPLGTSPPGDRGLSSSGRRPLSPRLSPAGLLMAEVGWPARPFPAVRAGTDGEHG